MLTAVWMHLDKEERRTAMPIVASLLAPDGVIIMALRHGPAPRDRIMFAVSAEETIAVAGSLGLQCILNVVTESKLASNRESGVTWSRVAFAPS